MKSNLEKRLNALRGSAEALVAAAHGADLIKMMCSFSALECVADVKLESEGWIRYLLIEGGQGEGDDTLRRIG